MEFRSSFNRTSLGAPTMSDRTLMLNIDDCIGLTFGPSATNCVNFSMMKTVLNILSRHMRILEKTVEIRFKEDEERIETMMQQLLEEKSEDSSEFKEDRKNRKRYVKESKSVDALTSDEIEDFVERKVKKSKDTVKKSHLKDEMDDDLSTSTEAEDDQEKEGKKGKAKAKAQKMDDDDVIDSKRSKDKSPKSQTTDRSDVGETYVKKGKDTLEMQLKTKKADDDADTVSDTKTTEGRVDKKEVKSKRSEGADDVTPELEETEYSSKGKGEKRKDKMMADMPKVQEARSKNGKTAADTHTMFGGISVTEVVRKEGKGAKDKILVVEKGLTTRDSYPRVGNIEVVTRSQFELVESDVKKLMKQSGPIPISFTPDNKQLKRDLVKGSATLPGAMEAMHLHARIKAAELALSRMAILLTKVASDGTLSPETADMINQLQKEQRELSRLASAKTGQQQQSTGSTAATMEESSPILPVNPCITQPELSQALDTMKHEMMKSISEITAKSTMAAEHAHNIAKTAENKLAITQALKTRIDILNKFITEQRKLLHGFDSGLIRKLRVFQEKLELMQAELKDGLKFLDRSDRLESSAVMELRRQHNTVELMVNEIEDHYEKLLITNSQMYDEFSNTRDWIDLIRREKADSTDVAEGLKDKVNLTELQGLLCEDAFEVSRKELNKQLEECNEEFDIISSGSMETLAGLKAALQKKANLMELHSLKVFAVDKLKEFKAWLGRLEDLLGDPQLALLTRLVSRNAYCGSCLVAADMVPFDKNYKKPPLLPVLGAPKVEEPAVDILKAPDNRKHIIKRWVGGSHTLIKNRKTSEKLPQSQLQPTPTKHIGSGIDEHIYTQEEEVLEACFECNQVLKDKTEDKTPQEPPSDEVGAGDQGPDQTGDQGPVNKDSDEEKGVSVVPDNKAS